MIRAGDDPRSLTLLLQVADDGIHVTYRLDGVGFEAGETVARMPGRIAGIGTAGFGEHGLELADDEGPIPFRTEPGAPGWAEGPGTCWVTSRATRGRVQVAYLARARTVDASTADGHPPVDLRTEAGGVTGQGRAFLALPPQDGPWDITVIWVSGPDRRRTGVCSLGTGDLYLRATPLEALLDCHYMAGEVTAVSHRSSQVSVHYLTRPLFDADAFADRTARVHAALASVFHEDPPPFRVFLRRNPYRGMSGSALRQSFVVGWHEQVASSAEGLNVFIDHELVHEWVQLDGPYEEAVWHNEGLAEYYGAVLPHRAGLTPDDLFLHQVNLLARLGYASPYRHVPLPDLMPLYWTDFRAQQEPYYRGFFYFARLDFALRMQGRAGHTLDDLVRQLRARRQAGELVGVQEWQSMVTAELGEAGRGLLSEVMAGSMTLPPGPVWGEAFGCDVNDAPVVDPGFDPGTFITRIVTGLRPGGPAAQAGLREGDVLLTMPTYEGLAALAPGQAFDTLIRRGNQESAIRVQASVETAPVPSWRPAAPGTGSW